MITLGEVPRSSMKEAKNVGRQQIPRSSASGACQGWGSSEEQDKVLLSQGLYRGKKRKEVILERD